MDASPIRHGQAFASWLNDTADKLRNEMAQAGHGGPSVAAICDATARVARSDERARIRRKAASYDRRRALPALLTLSPITAHDIAANCRSYDTIWVIAALGRRINQQIKLRRERSTFFDRRYLADLRAALGGEISQRRREAG
jgi:hypothetical protein